MNSLSINDHENRKDSKDRERQLIAEQIYTWFINNQYEEGRIVNYRYGNTNTIITLKIVGDNPFYTTVEVSSDKNSNVYRYLVTVLTVRIIINRVNKLIIEGENM